MHYLSIWTHITLFQQVTVCFALVASKRGLRLTGYGASTLIASKSLVADDHE